MQDLGEAPLQMKTLRTADFQEVTVMKGGRCVLRAAQAYGFRNIQNLVRKIKSGRCPYDLVEVMACPSGARSPPAPPRRHVAPLQLPASQRNVLKCFPLFMHLHCSCQEKGVSSKQRCCDRARGCIDLGIHRDRCPRAVAAVEKGCIPSPVPMYGAAVLGWV